jgi:CSLREA domain-containing protein
MIREISSKNNKTIILLLSLFVFFSINANAATYTVTKIADTNDGVCNGDCSLREAIAVANATTADDTIVFDSTVFASAQTITLAGMPLIIANNGTYDSRHGSESAFDFGQQCEQGFRNQQRSSLNN